METDAKLRIIIVFLTLFLILSSLIVLHEYRERQTQPQIVYVTPPRPDAFIGSFYNYPQDENTVRTSLFLKNRGASGLITVEYNAGGGFLQVKQYYLKAGESKSFEEIWNVPTDYNYVQCKILKQEIPN